MTRAFLIGVLLLGCGGESAGEVEDKPEETAPDPDVDPTLRIGHVMIEVGQRFENAGRGAEAANWGYAEYQVQEILEMFEMDMARALLPGDCNDAIADTMYENLLDQLPTLRQAAADEDAAAFREQFATSSGNCNGCHAGCNVPFIRVPSAPGVDVPIIGTPAPTSPEAPAAVPAEVLNPWADEGEDEESD